MKKVVRLMEDNSHFHKSSRQFRLSPVVGLLLIVAIFYAFGVGTFFLTWAPREAAIETSLNGIYDLVRVEAANSASGGDSNQENEPSIDVVEADIEIVSSVYGLRRTVVWQNVGEFAQGILAAERKASERSCRALEIARLSLVLPSVTQEATYETIARTLEDCLGRTGESGFSRKLCTGTRHEASSKICEYTQTFTSQLYNWDRGDGSIAFVASILNAIAYGVPQLICALLAIGGFVQVRSIGVHLGSNRSTTSPWIVGDVESVESMKARLNTEFAELENAGQKSNFFYLASEDFKEKLRIRTDRILARADTIVLIGLLGTLFGMLTLFGALAQAESAIPIVSQQASTKMLGSLGLAFGTTIFAALVRIVFNTFVGREVSVIMAELSNALARELQHLAKEGSELQLTVVGDAGGGEALDFDPQRRGRAVLEGLGVVGVNRALRGRNTRPFLVVLALSLLSLAVLLAGVVIMQSLGVLSIDLSSIISIGSQLP